MTDEREELMRFLQDKKDALRFALKNVEQKKDVDLINVMKGQLDAYSTTIAFILSGGKLK